MTYPAGVTTRTVTVGGAGNFETGDNFTIGLSVKAVHNSSQGTSLIWNATGWKYPSKGVSNKGVTGQEVSVPLPTTDIPGWRDRKLNALIDVSAPDSYSHRYLATVTVYDGNNVVETYDVGPFPLPAGDGTPVDLDLMVPASTVAGGAVAIPDSWSATVSGMDGRVATLETQAPTLNTAMEAERYTTMARLLLPPVAQDMPVVEVVPYAAPAGETLHTLKRVGDNTTNVDMAGDTKFRYDGTPSLIPVAADGSYTQAQVLTGGTTQGAYYTAAYETITHATNTYMKWQIRTSTATVAVRVSVNGRPTRDTQYTFTGLTAGVGMFLKITFPTPASRLVRLSIQGATGVKGVVIPTAETLTRPTTTIGKRVAILGDSYEGGSGTWPDGGNRLETAAYRVAMMLGADSIWQFAIGGTGYVAAPDSNAYGTRVADIVACDPDVAIVSGSINDSGADTPELRAAVASVLSGLASVPQVYVTGPSYPAGYSGNNAAVRAETIAAGRTWVDALAEPWLDVTTHIRSDGVHPNAAGHIRRSSRLYEAIAAHLAP